MLLSSFDFEHPDVIPKPAYPNEFYTMIPLDNLGGTIAFKPGRSRLTYHLLKIETNMVVFRTYETFRVFWQSRNRYVRS